MKYFNFRILLLMLSAVILPLAFQNCGNQTKISRVEQSSYASAFATATARICLPANEVLETLIVRNINAKVVDSRLLADSDGDGIDDMQEVEIGTNSLQRRSSGKVLDSICHQVDYSAECHGLQLTCSSVLMDFGLNSCDIEALQLNTFYAHPNQGLDTDKDGIADYFEIMAGTFPNVRDSTADLDQDVVPNMTEIERGTNPRQPDQYVPEEYLVKVQKSKLPPTLACAGDMWDVAIENVPLVHNLAYLTDADSDFNHQADENLIFVNLKTRPRLGSTANAKMYLLIKKVQLPTSTQSQSLDFNFTFTDFQKLGEIEP